MTGYKMLTDAIYEKSKAVIDMATFPNNMKMLELMLWELSTGEYSYAIESSRSMKLLGCETRQIKINLTGTTGIEIIAERKDETVTYSIESDDIYSTFFYEKKEHIGESCGIWERKR